MTAAKSQPIMTSSWYHKLDPAKYQRIGVSRGVPRNTAAGFRKYPKLNPGGWFNSVNPDRYLELYQAEVLGVLDPAKVVEELREMGGDKIPVLLCWEAATPSEKEWCHRGIVSAWLHDRLGLEVYEYGQEKEGFGWSHPKLYPKHRKREVIRINRADDLIPYLGVRFERGQQTFEVVGVDPVEVDNAVLRDVASNETMLVSVDLALEYVGAPVKKAGAKSGKAHIVGQQTLL